MGSYEYDSLLCCGRWTYYLMMEKSSLLLKNKIAFVGAYSNFSVCIWIAVEVAHVPSLFSVLFFSEIACKSPPHHTPSLFITKLLEQDNIIPPKLTSLFINLFTKLPVSHVVFHISPSLSPLSHPPSLSLSLSLSLFLSFPLVPLFKLDTFLVCFKREIEDLSACSLAWFDYWIMRVREEREREREMKRERKRDKERDKETERERVVFLEKESGCLEWGLIQDPSFFSINSFSTGHDLVTS